MPKKLGRWLSRLSKRRAAVRGESSLRAVDEVLAKRKKRFGDISGYAFSGAGVGATIALFSVSPEASDTLAGIKRKFGLVGASAVLGAVGGTSIGLREFAKDSKAVAAATMRVGKALTNDYEFGKNAKLNKLIDSYKYLYIDLHGNVAGTNRPQKTWLNRFRLETEKIRNNYYNSFVH